MFLNFLKSKDKSGNPTSALRIFLIIIFAIVTDQSMTGILLEEMAPIDPTGKISGGFLILSIPCAVFLASLSDFHCRRRIMIFALISLTISSIFILFFINYGSNWLGYLALLCKGIGGNVTPVALGSLAMITLPKKFTISLAIAICSYALGSWVPIYLRSFVHLSSFVPVFSLTCCIITIKWFKESEFDDFKLKNKNLNFKHFFAFLSKDWKEVALFCLLTPVLLVLLIFIFSEISFYQILLRGEVLLEDAFYSGLALRMGLAYYVGTFFLCVLQIKRFTDIRCLKLGATLALFSLFFALLLSFTPHNLSYNLFTPFFSFGFALFTPSLFSILSKSAGLDRQGKIYGLLDSTDTIALLVSTKYIKLFKKINYNIVFGGSLTLLIISIIFMWIFIFYMKKNKAKYNDLNFKKTRESK